MKKLATLGLALGLLLSMLASCAPAKRSAPETIGEPTDSMNLEYATEFSVDYYEGGYKRISIVDGGDFLVIPEGMEMPEDMKEAGVTPLQQPIENAYLAASAAMAFFADLGQVDALALSGAEQDSWQIPAAVEAMEAGNLVFAGKYSEPDYELMAEKGCTLAVESTMVDRVPEVKDKLRELGIAVLVDHSSKESHPLGRVEWIKLYAALFNEEQKAEAVFQKQVDLANSLLGSKETDTTVAFFYLNSDGVPCAPQADDYLSQMIALAGGKYVFAGPNAPHRDLETTKMEMETFFATAKDADCIIYNSTMYGELSNMEELLAKSDLMKEMKAVKNGNVWCTRDSMFQSTTDLGTIMESFHQIFSGEAEGQDEVPYLFRVH